MTGGGSWSMTEGQGDSLQIALYVRDSLGLAEGSSVPPLVPAVPPAPGPEPTEDDARAWRAWFTRLLAEEATGAPDDPLGQLLDAGPTPRLGTVASEVFDAARAWCEERKAANFEHFRGQTREQRLVITRLVEEVERSIGRRVAPFTLHLVTLPLAGAWERRVRHDLLLLSDKSRNDVDRLRAVLVPVVRELA